MARIRTIKPEFWRNESIASIPMGCRLLFLGMHNFADDQGVISANPILIKSDIFPFEEEMTIDDLKKRLIVLENKHLIKQFEHNGDLYYLIVGFAENQKIDKRYMKCIVPVAVVNRVNSPAYVHNVHNVHTPPAPEPTLELFPDVPDEPKPKKIRYDLIMKKFNSLFKGKLPQITVMSDKRKRAVRARIAEHGLDALEKVLEIASESKFLIGSNDRNWSADFDWIMAPTNFIKILEGNYNKRTGKVAHPQCAEVEGTKYIDF